MSLKCLFSRKGVKRVVLFCLQVDIPGREHWGRGLEIENTRREKEDQHQGSLAEMYIRQRRVQKCPKKIKSRVLWGKSVKKSGSIPEWNFGKKNITATWFNSRMEFRNPLLHSPPPSKQLNPIRIETYEREKGWGRSILGKGVSKTGQIGVFTHKIVVQFQNGINSK